MTSKLKCPFCQQGLKEMPSGIIVCGNPDCKTDLSGYKELWQALIQAKHDLEIARQALEEITKEHDVFADWVFKAVTMKDIAEKALEQIEQKE